jgi:cellulose synthase/poly-beta-1,6-N-acetylglucosamine synthase-like glycosyltransferase
MRRGDPGSLIGVMRLGAVTGTACTAVLNGYLAAVTASAALRRRRQPAAPTPEPTHRLAVLIPAHDEERIIGSTIDSVVGQDYPAHLREVHVVADNCTDGTAEVARLNGATVHERHDPADPGKGPALGWLVAQLDRAGDPPDAVVILDADTHMAPDVLRLVDVALAEDRSAWQTYYTVRDPELSPSTAVRHAALVLRHYVRPLGRTALGASSGLFGNGMVFRWEVLAKRRFSAHLTEDVEFQLELLLAGERVGFLPDAVVEAEMPATLEAARTQNERWELGRAQLARRYVPRLLAKAAGHRQPYRIAHVDAALDQLVPPLSVLLAATISATAASATAAVIGGHGRSRLGRAGTMLSLVSLGGFVAHVLGGLRVARVPRSVYAALLHAPRAVVWKVVLWLRVLLRPDRVSWTRTRRNAP